MKLLTGNDLKTGFVTWWTGADWSLHIEDAADVGEAGEAVLVDKVAGDPDHEEIAWTLVPSSTTIEHPDVITLPLGEAEASWIIGLIRPPGGDNPLIAPFWQTVAELGDPALTALADQGGAGS